MENSLKSVYKLTISIFLCIHMCVGKLALGMSNSDLEKVSLIACIGQFCSAMEIHSESVEKKHLLVSKSWTFLSYFKSGNCKFASNL